MKEIVRQLKALPDKHKMCQATKTCKISAEQPNTVLDNIRKHAVEVSLINFVVLLHTNWLTNKHEQPKMLSDSIDSWLYCIVVNLLFLLNTNSACLEMYRVCGGGCVLILYGCVTILYHPKRQNNLNIPCLFKASQYSLQHTM